MRPIRSPPNSVNQRAPSGPGVMSTGCESAFGRLNFVPTPAGVRRLIAFDVVSLNQTLPSGPWMIPVGNSVATEPVTVNSLVTTPAVVMRPTLLPLNSVNQRAPPGPEAMPPGSAVELTENSVIEIAAAGAPGRTAAARRRAGRAAMVRVMAVPPG